MTQGTASPHANDGQTSANRGVLYVYGVVPAALAPRHTATGVDDTQVAIQPAATDDARIAALVSVLDAGEYAPERLERRTADVNWLAPRATAHDRVLTWASDRGPVVPFPMFSVFSGESALQTMLRDRAQELERALARVSAGREYGVRLYRVDAELLPRVAELSPRIAELERTAAGASPGQRYLLERKLESSRREEMRGVGRAVADELWMAMGTHAAESVRLPVPRVTAADAEAAAGTMVLNSTFLIAPDALAGFQRVLTEFATLHDGRGFRLDFTGPWPPYHFVGDTKAARDDADPSEASRAR
jgi:hypothetical protein